MTSELQGSGPHKPSTLNSRFAIPWRELASWLVSGIFYCYNPTLEPLP